MKNSVVLYNVSAKLNRLLSNIAPIKHILTLVAIFVATANLSAQTYNGNTWYSLYETGERTLNTIDSETLNAFTPVGTNLTFDAKREPTGAKELKVAPIVNGNQ